MKTGTEMKTRKVGDRVMIEHIGTAVITSVVTNLYGGAPNMYRVRFDVPPPVEYNMGSLDGIAFDHDIQKP